MSWTIGILLLAIGLLLVTLWWQHQQNSQKIGQLLAETQQALLSRLNETALQHSQGITQSMGQFSSLLSQNLHQSTQALEKRFEQLSQTTDQRLQSISGRVEQRLSEGFEKTTATFTDIVKRLALIDDAQKKITALSENVMSLQAILSDKRSRGAFGEVQLNSLIRNVLPEESFTIQATLKTGTRVDCLLHLPEPSGQVPIDAKFPLENYRMSVDEALSAAEQKAAKQRFRQDIRKHIQDIQSKYLIPGETADGAIMFLPAEAVFADIHAHYPDLVELSHRSRVWIASPTTMMAILTTARAVLKDAATRKQIHIIQEHLHLLSQDFSRFERRMDNLARHIQQAHTDVDDIHISAKKITQRFGKIEKVDLAEPETLAPPAE